MRAYFGKLLRFWGVALGCEYPNHDGLRAHGGDITPYSCGRRTNSCRKEWPRSGAFFMANEAKKKSLFEVIYLDVGWKYTVERFQDVLITNLIWIAFLLSRLWALCAHYDSSILKYYDEE